MFFVKIIIVMIPEYFRQYLSWDIRSASLKYDKRLKKFFNGGDIRAVSERYFAIRKKLQSKGTLSAKRHLKKLSHKEKRFRTAVNHKIAKEIVNLVPAGGTIVLEELR
ncbi:MAG: hypothetical protein Q9M89_06460 [Persephonella sp.]|nr:hypothetical protein [Persephonella sp.]